MVPSTDGKQESQIYHWGIKKDTSLDGGRPGENPNTTGVSSDVPSGSIPTAAGIVNTREANLKEDAIVYNVVTPSLRAELEKAGVPIDTSGEVKYSSQAYTGVNLSEDSKVYSYDFLIAQKDMVATKLPEINAVRNDNNRVDTNAVVDAGMKNARSVGTERDGKVFVENNYTGRELRVTANSIKHGLHGDFRRILTNARIGAVIGDIVSRAIPINALHNEVDHVDGTYAMSAYAYDSDGREFIAIVTVEQRTNSVADVQVFDTMHAVSGRQKNGSRLSTRLPVKKPYTTTKIKISLLLEIVKSTHQSILSNDVLTHLGETRNANGYYADRVKFSSKMDTDYLAAVERGDMDTAQKMVDEAEKSHRKTTPRRF